MNRSEIRDELEQLLPLDEPMEEPGPRESVAEAPIGNRLPGTGGIGIGGTGKLLMSLLRARFATVGIDFPVMCFDSDTRPPDPVILPDGSVVELPADAQIPLGVDQPRQALKDYPLLVRRYETEGLLHGISVFE